MRRGSRFHAVLLAGGSGTRFWPLSRARRPKQFLALAGGDPLLLATWKRSLRLAPSDRVWVVAPRVLVRDVRRMLPGLRSDRLIVEPSPRDTAPAIALACATVAATDPKAVVGVFPTDHVIRDLHAFVEAVRTAAAAARQGALVCLGIRPDRPATGFGYLKCAAKPSGQGPIAVERFVEKPDAARARRFLRSGRYLWNGGMFVWSAGRFLEEMRRTEPGILDAVEAHLAGRRASWARAKKTSVDFAVMEKAREVSVVPLEAGWDDVGSWQAAARVRERPEGGSRDTVLVESSGSAVFSEGRRLVALVDVPGVIVVDTADALLVVSRESSEKVRLVVEVLRARGREDLL